jgi:hypothetical protein
MHLFTMFQEIIPYLLKSAQRLPTVPYEEVTPEEANELETNEKGVSILSFRDQASEIISRTYFMLQANFGPDGQTSMYKLLLSPLTPSDPYQAEVSIFGARSILDILVDETIDDINRPFLEEVFTFIVKE